jgi:two-component system sensor histidine kinase YesM
VLDKSVCDLGDEEVIQDYVIYEVHRMEGQYQTMRDGFVRWQIISIILIFSAVGFSVVAAWGLSKSIYTPIKKLHDVTTTITKNDLQALMTSDNVDEITEEAELQHHDWQHPGAAGFENI